MIICHFFPKRILLQALPNTVVHCEMNLFFKLLFNTLCTDSTFSIIEENFTKKTYLFGLLIIQGSIYLKVFLLLKWRMNFMFYKSLCHLKSVCKNCGFCYIHIMPVCMLICHLFNH